MILTKIRIFHKISFRRGVVIFCLAVTFAGMRSCRFSALSCRVTDKKSK